METSLPIRTANGTAHVHISFAVNLETDVDPDADVEANAVFKEILTSNLVDILAEFPQQLDGSHLLSFLSVNVDSFTVDPIDGNPRYTIDKLIDHLTQLRSRFGNLPLWAIDNDGQEHELSSVEYDDGMAILAIDKLES